MALRRCRRCPTLVPPGMRRGLCDDCRRAEDRDRGTREDRGYGTDHQAERAAIEDRIVAGELVGCVNPWCLTPGRPIGADELHLGHNPDRTTRGPEHAACNLAEAGRAAHQIFP